MTMILTGRPWLAMVASSGIDIWKPPSPHDGEDQLVGAGELRADGGGQAEAHRAEAAGVEPQARFVEADELRGPHLVLADVGGDDGLAAGEAVDLGHQVLRLDLVESEMTAVERMLFLPLADLAPPGAGGAACLASLMLRLQSPPGSCSACRGPLDVADDGQVRRCGSCRSRPGRYRRGSPWRAARRRRGGR